MVSELDEWTLRQLYSEIPPRGPRGTPECKAWEAATRRLKREAKRRGIDEFEAYKLCQEKRGAD